MKKGFTLIELLVAITIIGVISTLVFTNIRSGNPTQTVLLQADSIVSLLNKAKYNSQSGVVFDEAAPVGGYGINFEECGFGTTPSTCIITLFADTSNDFVYGQAPVGGGGEGEIVVPAGSEFVEEIEVSDPNFSIRVQANYLNEDFSDQMNVIFKPPQPIVCFNGNCSNTEGDIVIQIAHEDTNQTASITIDRVTGQVSVQS